MKQCPVKSLFLQLKSNQWATDTVAHCFYISYEFCNARSIKSLPLRGGGTALGRDGGVIEFGMINPSVT